MIYSKKLESFSQPWHNNPMELNESFKIRVGSLLPDRPLPFDLFIFLNKKMVHYLRSGDELSQDKINKLDRADVFYVPLGQRQDYKNFVYQRLNEDNLKTEVKAQILRESSITLVDEIFENPDVGSALTDSKEVIGEFVKFVDEAPEGLSHLIHLSSHDFYTYNHSLDVSIYALGLGMAVGYKGEELQELGRGSIFHDIGKRLVDVNIICKNGALDEVEWAQMQQHPTFGLQILDEYDVSEEIKACCFEHHENFLGNGYPQQLDGDEIHPMARIVALTDTYDALTTKRSYNKPMLPREAIEFMTEKLAQRYDPDLLKAMNEVMVRMDKDKASA